MFEEFGPTSAKDGRSTCHDALVEARNNCNESNIVVNYETGMNWDEAHENVEDGMNMIDPNEWKAIAYTLGCFKERYDLVEHHNKQFTLPMRIGVHPERDDLGHREIADEVIENYSDVEEFTAIKVSDKTVHISYYGGVDKCFRDSTDENEPEAVPE